MSEPAQRLINAEPMHVLIRTELAPYPYNHITKNPISEIKTANETVSHTPKIRLIKIGA